ncbi:MAG: SDR family NAD(P)-dependent oxidoreductase [Paracoccus sp. (in: a-proteobacteria)]|uniref:SDR family NAD(P)-dependent oxidoreductase n=1 Tax=Paracoccus sp. TaxID=267 RepID=UPI0026DEA577|nr:SDR family NAD(P)-dependent oxidoreductase [Paracoccus sp. (in: a-proteobacteria)]MDO5619955.1 SDR family NAD(P)-dependent oxidoreductase [Paracoccus sp. (in: a-proteobacteria)]
MRGLKDKLVVVTGGGGGIGSATCLRFAQEGARVVVADISTDAAQAVVDQITASGGAAFAMIADLTDHAATGAAVERVQAELGPIDILVNNAGWDLFVPFLKQDPDFWTKIIDINLRSVLNITQPVLASMVARGNGGRIVSVGSDAGRVGSSGESVYAACKAGIIAFMKTLAREHARDQITFNTVCPGVTETAMLDAFLEAAGDTEKLRGAFARAVPMGRLGRPDDLPGAILFLASDDAAFITGQVISVSGGLTMHG